MGGIITIVIAIMVINFVAKAKKAIEDQARAARGGAAPGGGSGAEPPPAAEALNLQDFLRKMEQAQQMAAARRRGGPASGPTPGKQPGRRPPATKLPARDKGPMGRPSRVALPSATEAENRTSLEVAGERAEIDLDEAAQAVVERRIAEAEARDYQTAAEAHSAFDARIRQEAADNTAVARPRFTGQQLRDAIVWREILGPPVGLRD